jgi:hypothetical protein
LHGIKSRRQNYNIGEITAQDILKGGFLDTLENLSVKVTDVRDALKVLLEI